MPGTTSGRYGIDSLSALAMMYDSDAVYRGSVFAFCHKSRMQIRFLIWDDGGYWLITRKIYSNSFIWPDSEADADLIKGSVAMIKRILRSAGYSKKELSRRYSQAV
jgi:transposase